jgi:hypothetical protein
MTHISTARLWLVDRKPAAAPDLFCGMPLEQAAHVLPWDAAATSAMCPDCLAARAAVASVVPPSRGVGGYVN